ncbi:DUF2493 domain-containing protein [Hyphomicrobium sp. B1]|uniref:DUF2493 domain-containing protein n=1 Tax=unclassified Hyphomicrobium TaxID=2619925 RepID=UPI0039188A93
MTLTNPLTGYPTSSATARAADHMALHGFSPREDEPDTRPVPEDDAIAAIVTHLFEAVTAPLADTALEPDVPNLLWSVVNMFQIKLDRLQRELDDNELRQREAQEQQDGSEIRSLELERLLDKGHNLLDRREAFEAMRDAAAESYADFTGSAWKPSRGSLVNHKKMTASLIDSRDFLSARKYAETNVLLPSGTKIAFAGGQDCNDVDGIWRVLDKVFAKYPDMILMHGGNQRGAERIASCWAEARKVREFVFRPDFKLHAKAAPFKRNDRMLEAMPQGLIVFPGNGITDNLADKAKKLGVSLIDMRSR